MAYDFSHLNILLVEDNQPMTELIKSLLLVFGVKDVVTARSGTDALDKVVRHNPDIIITDWMMREMDGIALTREVRQSGKAKNPFVPIVMITGFSEKRRVVQARDAGITEFLVKPFTAQDLYRRLEEIIERPRQFVRSEKFFGPDRRRRKDPAYTGPMRRDGETSPQPRQEPPNLDRIVLYKDHPE